MQNQKVIGCTAGRRVICKCTPTMGTVIGLWIFHDDAHSGRKYNTIAGYIAELSFPAFTELR